MTSKYGIGSAAGLGIYRCHDCGLLLSASAVERQQSTCQRCDSQVHARIPDSLQRTLVLVLTGFVFFIPANLLPIMTIEKLGAGDPHTIFSGIVALIHAQMYPIAIVVLIASILVPLLKLIGLSMLILIVRYRWAVNARRWSKIYRAIAFVGRWSMLDIFMISILVAIVDLGKIADVVAGPAATAFALVVVLTMFAANSFDPRLIWDSQETTHEKRY